MLENLLKADVFPQPGSCGLRCCSCFWCRFLISLGDVFTETTSPTVHHDPGSAHHELPWSPRFLFIFIFPGTYTQYVLPKCLSIGWSVWGILLHWFQHCLVIICCSAFRVITHYCTRGFFFPVWERISMNHLQRKVSANWILQTGLEMRLAKDQGMHEMISCDKEKI